MASFQARRRESSNLFSFLDPALLSATRQELESCMRIFSVCAADPDEAVRCQEVLFSGRLARGECCDVRRACALDDYCAMVDPRTTGTCTARIPVGQPCTTSSECEVGSECRSSVCSLPQPLVEQGDACTSAADCQYPLVCVSDNTCQLGAVAGQPCTEDEACAQGTYCAEGTCRPWGDEGDLCEPARIIGNESVGGCKIFLTCDPSTETSVQVGNRGPSCGETGCRDQVEDYCDNDTCTARIPVGSRCVRGACEIGATCTNGVCAALPPVALCP